MKAVKSTRFNTDELADEAQKRGTKLTPNKKSGKERHQLYRSLEEDEQEEYSAYPRESALDYIDNGEDDDLYEDDDDYDED